MALHEKIVWRIKYDNELYGLYTDLDIFRAIKVAWLRWLELKSKWRKTDLAKR
jgi:hypothetical protein